MHLQKTKNHKAFSLVELLVAVGIASMLMLGMSVFFSGTFQNLMAARQQSNTTQEQFHLQALLSKKFQSPLRLVWNDPTSVILQNTEDRGAPPFFYLGKMGNKVVIKDFLPFYKKVGTTYGDPKEGKIKTASGDISGLPHNFAGFDFLNGTYYVAVPFENKLMACTGGTCQDFATSEALTAPMDVATDGTDLYVSQASGSVVRITLTDTDKTVTPVVAGLNYPTGLALSEDKKYLFVSETLGHRVSRIDLADKSRVTVAGEGGDEACNGGSAVFCKLLWPASLSVVSNKLYITDSGHERVLKVSDPGEKDINAVPLELSFDQDTSLKTIKTEVVSQNPFTTPPAWKGTGMPSPWVSTEGTSDTAYFETALAKPIDIEQQCSESGCIPIPFLSMTLYQPLFKKDDVFQFDSQASQTFVVGSDVKSDGSFFTYEVVGDTTAHSVDEPVSFEKNLLQKSKDQILAFTLDLSTLFSAGLPKFIGLKHTVNGDEGFSVSTVLRNGDGLIGGPEDTVSVEVVPPVLASIATSVADFGVFDFVSEVPVSKFVISNLISKMISVSLNDTTLLAPLAPTAP